MSDDTQDLDPYDFLDDEEAEELDAEIEAEEESDDDGYISFEVPEVDDEDDPRAWYSHLPADHNGVLDWDKLIFIGGKLPTTTTSRKAMMLVPKTMKKDPLLAIKESNDNLLRLCITEIGEERLNSRDLRGERLDGYLTYKQQQLVSGYFDKLTSATEDEQEAFMKMTQHGRKRSK